MELLTEKYKQTEIGLIPLDWEIKSLDNFTEIYVGKDLKEKSYSTFQDYKFKYPVYSNTVENEGLYGYYDMAEYEGDSLTIVGRGVGLGTTFKRTGGYGAIGRLLVLFPDKDIDSKFLTDYINHRVIIFSESNAIPQLTGISISSYKIALPPTKAEQTAIATALTDADNYITHIEKLIAKKRLIKQGAMQELLRPKEEWVVKKLGEIAEIATGTTPPTKDLDNYGDEYCFVSPADLGEFKFITRTEKKLSKKGFHLSRKFPQKSILFTCIGSTIGKMGIASFEMTSNQQINAVMPNDLYSTEFMYYYLLLIADQIKSSATEQAVPMINKTEFQKIAIQFPTLIEQIRISMILSDLDEELTALELQLAKAQNIKQGMMQQLLTGKIRLV